MKKENTAIRLKKIMSEQNLRQVDILTKTVPYCEKYNVKMNKSDISQYCSGKTEPNQDKLFVLSLALNVNEAWLMGFDVPMERDNYEDQNIITFEAKSDAAQVLLMKSGYQISISDDEIITISDLKHNIICSLREYEFVNIYESLIKQNKHSAQEFIDELSVWWKKIDNYFSGKEAPNNIYAKFSQNLERHHGKTSELLKIYNQLSSKNKDKTILYSQQLLSLQKMDEELMVDAAHARTDLPVTHDDQVHDTSIMDNDSEWE